MRKHKKIGRSLLRSGQLTILLLLISCFVSAQTNTSSNSPCDFSTYHPAFFSHFENYAVHRESPEYPEEARRKGIKGTIVVVVLIDREGNVVKTCCEEGDELLRAAALKAASKWKFTPFGKIDILPKCKYIQHSLVFDFKVTNPAQSEDVPPWPTIPVKWTNQPATTEKNSRLLEEAAARFAEGQSVPPRVVLYDIGYPHDIEEYNRLNGHAVLMLTAISHRKAELPLKRVYVLYQGRPIELLPVQMVLSDRSGDSSAAVKVFGAFRADILYLLPVYLRKLQCTLLVDFTEGSSGMQVAVFGTPVSPEVGQLPVKPPAGPSPSGQLLDDFIRREFPFFFLAGAESRSASPLNDLSTSSTRKEPRLADTAPEDRPFHVQADQNAAFVAACEPYIRKARETWPDAKARFLEGLPSGESFFITVRLFDEHRRFEQVFVAVDSITDGVVDGRIWSEPSLIPGYKLRDRIRVKESELIDWTISKPDGSEEGNFVGKFIESHKP
ncbi:MAG: TonB family protein [Acidobacteria bacterium]|nr:TonB family protein [Acidobacteriota bacterium]